MTLGELRGVMSIGTPIEVYTVGERPGDPKTLYAGHTRFLPSEFDKFVVSHFHISEGTLEIKVSDPEAPVVNEIYCAQGPDFMKNAVEMELAP